MIENKLLSFDSLFHVLPAATDIDALLLRIALDATALVSDLRANIQTICKNCRRVCLKQYSAYLKLFVCCTLF